jgi:hypothetical protein
MVRLVDVRWGGARVALEVDHGWDDFHPPGPGRVRPFGEGGVPGNHGRSATHGAVDLGAEQGPDRPRRMPIVAMEHGIIEIDQDRPPGARDESLQPVRYPGQDLVVDPQEVEPACAGRSGQALDQSHEGARSALSPGGVVVLEVGVGVQ